MNRLIVALQPQPESAYRRVTRRVDAYGRARSVYRACRLSARLARFRPRQLDADGRSGDEPRGRIAAVGACYDACSYGDQRDRCRTSEAANGGAAGAEEGGRSLGCAWKAARRRGDTWKAAIASSAGSRRASTRSNGSASPLHSSLQYSRSLSSRWSLQCAA